MEGKRPLLLRVIQNDYVALIAFLFPIVFWAFYAFDMFLGGDSWPAFIFIVLAVTVTGFAVLIWRYWLILSVFTQGIEVSGTISRISFFRDRGRVDFIYTWYEEKYASGMAVVKTKRTSALREGQVIDLMVDSGRPRNAFIRDLFL
ncbi:MAG: hypothetical protein JXR84_23955 [Anaerolineae bacterium]|nr:hypothetical protein [Anaerolineae bacterium]